MFPNQRQFFRCPLPGGQSLSVLVIGWRRFPCRLIEMSLGGFAVVVPRVLPPMPQSLARLKVQGLDYVVRVTRQEPRNDGFLVALEQVEELVPNCATIPATPAGRWLTATAWMAAVGIVVAALYFLTAASVTGTGPFGF